ncbi:DUF6624 domain-containing protein [Winogradskyella sp. R77965]|uniref:DUF6624 domain-containing protein n=1 Tax=Winogradskyella sp. R77965 TaxID=3093872 RepID=UPI0037DC1932
MKLISALLFSIFTVLFINAQDNTSFKSLMIEAWELHTQKHYDSAVGKYTEAFKIYQKPKISYGVKPEYKSLAKKLKGIFNDDQNIRNKYVKKNYPIGSKKRDKLVEEMQRIDSINVVKIEAIINKHGWLGPDSVGYMGNKAFFYVIQHANIDTQISYFPIILDALYKGYVEPYQMAYLIDRISLREKRLLIFGSEVRQDADTQDYYVAPTHAIDSLDARRALVGLKPMKIYLKKYNTTWDVEAYKANLAELMKKLEY